MFKVGDRVKLTKDCQNGTRYVKGHIGIIKSEDILGAWTIRVGPRNYRNWVNKDILELSHEAPMSLQQRIEALNNGWDKEADDILQEMWESDKDTTGWFSIIINPSGRFENTFKEGKIIISTNGAYNNCVIFSQNYTSQYSKMRAFKDALLYLLDKSGLKEPGEGDMVEVEVSNKQWEAKLVRRV